MPAEPVATAAPPRAVATTAHRSVARLLTDVEAGAHARGWGRPASLLRVDDDGGRLVVATRSLPADAHPAAALLGRMAPGSSVAVGVVAEGRAHRTGGGDDATSPAARRSGGAPPPGGTTGFDGAPGVAPRDDATVGEPEGCGAGERVRVAVLVARDGGIASVVRLEGGPPSLAAHHPRPGGSRSMAGAGPGAGVGDRRRGAVPGPGSAGDPDHGAGAHPLGAGWPPPAAPGTPTGRLVDLLLRGLALPTAPPPTSTTRLWAVLWLQAVAAVARAAPGLPWPVVAALHPARRILSGGAPPAPGAVPEAQVEGAAGPASAARIGTTVATPAAGGAAVTAGDPAGSLVAAGTAAGGLVTWARLHADAAVGRWPAPGLTPADASWLDTGAFARWVLGDLPPVGALARAAADHLHPCVATTLERVLGAWGLGADRAG